jgi:hypothetical protein
LVRHQRDARGLGVEAKSSARICGGARAHEKARRGFPAGQAQFVSFNFTNKLICGVGSKFFCLAGFCRDGARWVGGLGATRALTPDTCGS